MNEATKVFIVVERVEYEGDTVLRVFGNYKMAIKYADELEAKSVSSVFSYDVFEREVY